MRMVRPSGTVEAPGARSAGRPMYMMSCELALVAGRLCNSPGCERAYEHFVGQPSCDDLSIDHGQKHYPRSPGTPGQTLNPTPQ